MIRYLEAQLSAFKECFHRTAAYRWFVVVIMGLLTRYDQLGVTSIIRSLDLPESAYEKMIHFFRSSAYSIQELKKVWLKLIAKSNVLIKINDRPLLLGDGTKVSKEGKHMPGVKKLFQESENSAKAPYISGHMYGGTAIAISNGTQDFAIPYSMEIHDGLSATAEWDGNAARSESHTTRMIENGYEAAITLGTSYLVLDRYFLTVPALSKLDELNKSNHILDIITRAKNNCIAYEEPNTPTIRKRGRPRKHGNAVKLIKLFDDCSDDFQKATVTMYGTSEPIEYLCKDLLWGVCLYHKLRFILVKSRLGKAIFVSTDLTLAPDKIIEAYAHRFKIETMFRELKQQVGAFCYHFWTKAVPKFNWYKKKTDPDPLVKVEDEHDRECILATVEATERFVLFSCITLGLTQLMALTPAFADKVKQTRYLRTASPDRISEATVLEYFQHRFFRLLLHAPCSELTQIIHEAQKAPSGDDKAA